MFWREIYIFLTAFPAFLIALMVALTRVSPELRVWLATLFEVISRPENTIGVVAFVLLYPASVLIASFMARRSEKPKPDFKVTVLNIISGGVLPGPQERFALVLDVNLINVGNMNSAIPHQTLQVEIQQYGKWKNVQLLHHQANIKIGTNVGSFLIAPKEYLAVTAQVPVEVGAICHGFLLGAMDESQKNSFEANAPIRLRFCDVTGRKYSLSLPRGAVVPAAPYIPNIEWNTKDIT